MCFRTRDLYHIESQRDISILQSKNIEFALGEHIDKRRIRMREQRNQLREDSIAFAISVAEVCEQIKGSGVFVNQLLRASSSIGANLHEAKYAQSRLDFISKMEIALKESSETEYWLELIYRRGKLAEEQYKRLRNLCGSIRRRLIASITTAKGEKGSKG